MKLSTVTLFWLGGLLAAAGAVVYYGATLASLPVGPSGRTGPGIVLGILGTLAMIGAGLYAWRRRAIGQWSRLIYVSPEARRDLFARERRALQALQKLQQQLMRNPGQNTRPIAKEAKKIIRENKVRRTIRAHVTGRPPRLVFERREWMGRVQTWYYWHLTLGVLSVLFILLHAGFRFGNVVATLAFVFLVGVVVTGILGVWIYWSVPPSLTRIEERAEKSPEELRDELESVDAELRSLVEGKSEKFRSVYAQELAIPGISMKPSLRWLTQPASIERDATRPDRLRLIVKEIPPREQEDFRKAMRLIFRKEKLEVSLYPQLRYDYLLKVWLTAHIPLSAGLAAFSVIHIVSVFYY